MTKKSGYSDYLVSRHIDNIFIDILKDSGWSDDAINAWGEAQVKEYNRVASEEETNAAPRTTSEKALAWAKRNPWYGDPAYNGKTSFAYSIHRYLANKGVDLESDAYYAELDERLSQWAPPFHDVYPPNEFDEVEEKEE